MPLSQSLAQSKGQIIRARIDEGMTKPDFKMHLTKQRYGSLATFVESLRGSLAKVLYGVRVMILTNLLDLSLW